MLWTRERLSSYSKEVRFDQSRVGIFSALGGRSCAGFMVCSVTGRGQECVSVYLNPKPVYLNPRP